jgi:hypothetical protein
MRSFADKLAGVYCDVQNGTSPENSDLKLLSFIRTFGANGNAGLNVALPLALSSQAQSSIITALSQNRPDKQAAATSSSSGTTQLVEKAGGSELLALAIDAGALTKTTNGSTATVSGNLEGILSTLLGQNSVGDLDKKQGFWKAQAGNVDLSASFTLNQQGTTTTEVQPANANPSQTISAVYLPSTVGKLSGITAKYTILNKFDPKSSKFQKSWSDQLSKSKALLNTSKNNIDIVVFEISEKLGADKAAASDTASKFETHWQTAEASLAEALKQPTPNQFVQEYSAYYYADLTEARRFYPQFDDLVLSLESAKVSDEQLRRQMLSQARGILGSIEYTYNRPALQPETHNVTYIFSYSPSGNCSASGVCTWSAATGNVPLFSANADISIYGGTIPSGAKYGRLHYGQASAEFDRPLAPTGKMNSTIFTLAAYGQYQPDPSVLNITPGDVAPGTTIDAPTQVLVGTKGMLFVAQAKLAVKSKGGISVPFGVKWSNKTDLLGSNKLGAQVGISYDFSSLSSLFGGSTAQQ